MDKILVRARFPFSGEEEEGKEEEEDAVCVRERESKSVVLI